MGIENVTDILENRLKIKYFIEVFIIELPNDSRIPILDSYPNNLKHRSTQNHIHDCPVQYYSNQKVETLKMSSTW